MPDDIARWNRQRGNLKRLLDDVVSGSAADKDARIYELREQLAAVDEHIANLNRRRSGPLKSIQ